MAPMRPRLSAHPLHVGHRYRAAARAELLEAATAVIGPCSCSRCELQQAATGHRWRWP